jgi:hypothetical protein
MTFESERNGSALILKACCGILCVALNCFAEVKLPEGTKIRVRLDQALSSSSADEGQTVELVVTEPVMVGPTTVIAEGSRVTGTVTQAQEKRRMGRAGKLDFSIDRVKATDEHWIPLRYSLNKKTGSSDAVKTGVLTAGAAILFWPAAPVFLLIKGKDITLNKGMAFEVFTDSDYTYNRHEDSAGLMAAAPQTGNGGTATVALTSVIAGADIEVDGSFVGNTPTTVQLPPGEHRVVIRSGAQNWDRTVHVESGSTVTLNAAFH